MTHEEAGTIADELVDNWEVDASVDGWLGDADTKLLKYRITAAMKQAAQEAVTCFQKTIQDYVIMRAEMAEHGITVERLAGNVVKEARESAALAELQGIQDAVLNYWKLPQAAQPVWTKNKPMVAGWYWWRKSKVEPAAYHVSWISKDFSKRLYVAGCGEIEDFKDGEWAGPLPLPREA